MSVYICAGPRELKHHRQIGTQKQEEGLDQPGLTDWAQPYSHLSLSMSLVPETPDIPGSVSACPATQPGVRSCRSLQGWVSLSLLDPWHYSLSLSSHHTSLSQRVVTRMDAPRGTAYPYLPTERKHLMGIYQMN